MNIAFIAHDKKKELMVQFCIAYCGILSKHKLCATAGTGKAITEVTGLNIYRFMSGDRGGNQQIASRIAYDEVDMLLFFRDSAAPTASRLDEIDLLRLCDMHNVPVATNIATAEILVRALERGDLDWREVYNANKTDIF